MKIRIKDETSRDNSDIFEFMKGFIPYTRKKLNYSEPFSVRLVSDEQNAEDPLGKTAYYSPEDFTITLFVDGRHTKDIMRSLSHEIVHHAQNCRGEMDSEMSTGEGYAQKDSDLRNLEGEAYLYGNGLLFRDYEDSLKRKRKKMDKKQVNELLSRAFALIEKQDKKNKTLNESKVATKKESIEEDDEFVDSVVDRDTAGLRVSSIRNERLFEKLTKRYTGTEEVI